jgi:hypothetical protein
MGRTMPLSARAACALLLVVSAVACSAVPTVAPKPHVWTDQALSQALQASGLPISDVVVYTQYR